MELNERGVIHRIPQTCVSVWRKGIARVFSEEAGQVLTLMHWPRSSVHPITRSFKQMRCSSVSVRLGLHVLSRTDDHMHLRGLRPDNIDGRSQRRAMYSGKSRIQKLVNSITTTSCVLAETLLPSIALDRCRVYSRFQVTTIDTDVIISK